MKRILTLFSLLLFFILKSFAQTKGDPVGLGNGQNGSVTINTFNTIINNYAQLTSAVNAGSKTLNVSSTTGFNANTLVMIIQMSGHNPTASGNQGPFVLTSSDVGRFELIRIQSVGAGTITLVDGVRRSFPGLITQIVSVPEYTSLTLANTGTIIAPFWNGATGGIIAFLATGTVTVNNSISVMEVGLRGGMPIQDLSGSTNCSELDQVSPQGGRKGESLVASLYGTASGRGNVLNGGGGGLCVGAGGGGGSNIGKGGKGGFSVDGGRDVGGLGGGNLLFDPTTNLLLGGGGGAGHVTDLNVVPGANGGGIIFIRAHSVTGTGSLEASGASATFTDDLGDGTAGAPGGGAGGTIHVRAVSTIDLQGSGIGINTVFVNGGNGGSQNRAGASPGGGGGGGHIFLQGSVINVIEDIIGGFAGFNFADPGFINYNNEDGEPGVFTTIPSGMVIPASPAISTPANGATTNRRPAISGTGPANTTINIYVDDIPLGSTTTNGTGNFSFTPNTDLAVGGRILRATAEVAAIESPYSTAVAFTTSGTLPVILENFTAQADPQGHLIRWKIAESYNNAFFSLFHSTDNMNWVKVHEIAHQQDKNYQYLHRASAARQHFYKLVQTDLDGRSKELGIRRISGNEIVDAIQVYPNPANEYLYVRSGTGRLQYIKVFGSDGRVLFEEHSNTTNLRIPVKDFTNGIYFIRITAGQETLQQSFIIAR
jgi:hypothetical protein